MPFGLRLLRNFNAIPTQERSFFIREEKKWNRKVTQSAEGNFTVLVQFKTKIRAF